MNVAVIEVACAGGRADVPRSVAVADVHRAGRFLQLVAAVAAAEIALVVRVAECAADEHPLRHLDVAARRDAVDVGAAGQEPAVEVVVTVVVADPRLKPARTARRVDAGRHPRVDRAERRLLDAERRFRQRADARRAFEHRCDELRDHRVCRRRRMNAVREHERARGIRSHQVGARAQQRRRRAARRCGRIDEAERRGICEDLVEQRKDVDAHRRRANYVEPADQRAVVKAGDRADLRALAGRDAERRSSDVRQVEDDDVARAGGLQDRDLPHEIAGSGGDVRLQLRRRDHARARGAELEEDVVRAAPYDIKRAAVERSAREQMRHLRRDGRGRAGRRAVRHSRQAGDARAAFGEIGAALVGRNRRQPVALRQHLRPNGTRIRREQPGAGRQAPA